MHAYYIISLFLTENFKKTGVVLSTVPDFHHLGVKGPLRDPIGEAFGSMYEVAAIAEEAASLLQECPTALGLVFAVLLLILLELVQSVGELAAVLIGAAAVLNESLAQLGLLLGGGATRRLLSGEGVGGSLGEEQGRSRGRDGGAGSEHYERVSFINNNAKPDPQVQKQLRNHTQSIEHPNTARGHLLIIYLQLVVSSFLLPHSLQDFFHLANLPLIFTFVVGMIILIQSCQQLFQYLTSPLQFFSMEQPSAPSSPKPLDFQVQLQNLSNLQAKIEETRRSLNQLAKLETNQAKSIDALYKLSLMTTRNKLNLFQTHALSKSKHTTDHEELKVKQERVREIKERQERERKQIRQQLRKNKENERMIVKSHSQQYDQAIRKNRKLQLQKKGQLVKEVKQEKQQLKESLLHSRIVEKQQKEVALFNTTLAKIERQPSLAKELSQLLKQKQDMEQRVAERQEMKQKMKEEIDRLKKLKEEEVAVALKEAGAGVSLGEKALSTRLLFFASKA